MIDRSPRTGFEVGRRPAAAQAVPKRVGPSVSAKPAASRARGFGANKVNALPLLLIFQCHASAMTPWLNRGAAATTPSSSASAPNARAPSCAPELEYLEKELLEKEIGEAPPSRLERVGLLAERVARLRLARAIARKRNWRSAAQPARAGRSAGGARRSAPPRTRTREISANKANAGWPVASLSATQRYVCNWVNSGRR